MTLRELINSCLNRGQLHQVVKHLKEAHYSDLPEWKIGELYDSTQALLAELLETPELEKKTGGLVTPTGGIDHSLYLAHILWQIKNEDLK